MSYGNFLTEVFNSPTVATAAGAALKPQAIGKILWTYKSANTASISVQWQGSVDGTNWTSIGSAQTATGGLANNDAWPLVRPNVTITTNAAKTLTSIARVGNVATATLTSHGFVAGDTITVAGATPAGYNGVVTVVSAPDANTFTYIVSDALTTPPTGTITATAHVKCKVSC